MDLYTHSPHPTRVLKAETLLVAMLSGPDLSRKSENVYRMNEC